MATGVDVNVTNTWASVATGDKDVTISSRDIGFLWQISGSSAPTDSGHLLIKGLVQSLHLAAGEQLWIKTPSQYATGVVVVTS